jgi:hypothetical protein
MTAPWPWTAAVNSPSNTPRSLWSHRSLTRYLVAV